MNPISKWIALLIALALCGYAVFAIKYQSIADQQRDLLRNNTTYIDLERLVRDASASHKYATLAAAQTTAIAGRNRQIIGQGIRRSRTVGRQIEYRTGA